MKRAVRQGLCLIHPVFSSPLSPSTLDAPPPPTLRFRHRAAVYRSPATARPVRRRPGATIVVPVAVRRTALRSVTLSVWRAVRVLGTDPLRSAGQARPQRVGHRSRARMSVLGMLRARPGTARHQHRAPTSQLGFQVDAPSDGGSTPGVP